MKGIYAAVRSSFHSDQRLFKVRDPASSISYAFMNALSQSAMDENLVDKFLVFTNTNPAEDESITDNIISNVGVDREKIIIRHSQDYSVAELIAFLKNLAGNTRTIMVGAISVVQNEEDKPSKYSEPEKISKYFTLGQRYVDTDSYQNELFPLDISQGIEQEEFLKDEISQNPSIEVRGVNGVASVLLKAEQDFPSYHNFPLIKVEHLSFIKEDILVLAKFLRTFSVNKDWIVEIDYLTFEDLENFKTELSAHNIEIPEIKSGGSIFYGNSIVLNGLRAISSAMAQLEHSPEEKALAIVLTERNTIELFILNYDMEEIELD